MNKFLFAISIVLILSIINCQESNKNKKLESAKAYIFSNGIKVGKGIIDIKQMSGSITRIKPMGTDLEEYEAAHRGIIIRNIEIINEEVNKIVVKQDGKADEQLYIIPYRFLSQKFECEEDSFFGFYCTGLFRIGSEDDDFKSELALTFGHCAAGMNRQELNSLQSIIQLLTTAHKEILTDKVISTQKAAEEYNYYSDLFESFSTKNEHKDSTEVISELDKKIDVKNVECEALKKEYDTSKKEYENHENIVFEDKEKLGVLNSELEQLQDKKAAYEKTQIDRRNASKSSLDRQKKADELKQVIIQALHSIKNNVDPDFFDRDCLNEKGDFDPVCLERLNKIH
jgi:hypothetical protein